MPTFALLAALLLTEPAPEVAVAPVLVGLDVEAGRTALGCFALWSERPAGEPVPGADGYPSSPDHLDAGDLVDVGGVPFRSWVSVDFEGRVLSLLDGDYGVGFTPHLWLRPDLLGPDDAVGGSGSVRFDGTLTVALRGTPIEETLPLGWARGFAAGPSGPDTTHRTQWSGDVPVRTSGTAGPYAWTVRGTLNVDLHVYSESRQGRGLQ